MTMREMLLVVALLAFIPAEAVAVTCNVTQSTTEFIELNKGGELFRVFQSDLRQGSDTLREAELQARLTTIIQFRQTRSDLPVDDPDRFNDPGGILGEKLYWCDVDGSPTPQDPIDGTHMCSNGGCVIDNVDLVNGSFVLTIRNSRDCSQDPDFLSCL